MMKKHLLILLTLLLVVSAALLSCGGDTTTDTPAPPDQTTTGGGTADQPSGGGSGTTEDLKPIDGVTFSDRTVPYNFAEQSVTVTGELPSGVSCTYTYNGTTAAGAKGVGSYTVVATLSGEGYATKTLTATLTITPLPIDGVTFSDRTVPYNFAEQSITVTGELPSGVSCTYTYNGTAAAGAKGVGSYTVVATLSGEGYATKTLTATLTITPLPIDGVTFSDRTVPYNFAEQSITVTGELPSGVSCTYTYNGTAAAGAKGVGSYTVVATLSGEGYATKTLTATLTITPLPIDGVTLADDSVEYDGLPHSLRVTGNVPSAVRCTYTYNGEVVDEVTDPGTYTVVATLSGEGYTTLTLRAELKITSKLEQLYTYSFGGKVYFQNPLHDNLLYVWDGEKLSKVDGNEKPQFFAGDSKNLYFISKGMLRSSIKSIAADGSVSLVLSDGGEYLATDGTYLYFAKNSLVDTGDSNGIYRIKISHGADDAAEKIAAGKASYLTVVGNDLYYAAGSSKGALTRIPKSGGTPETLTEENVSNIVVNDNILYFNVHTLTGNAIHRYGIDTGTLTKMTTDSGDNLTIVGQYLYYINSDLLTGKVFGDGIYRVALDASGSLPGEKVVTADVSSLTSDGTNLYYYLVNTKHLHRYHVADGTTTDLMASFVPVDDTTASASSYTYVKEYKGEIYFLNARDGSSVWKYNPATRASYKVISDSCSAFYFNGDYLYYSTFVVTNYALWRVPLAGGEAEKISSDRCDELLFIGEYIYFVHNGNTYNTLRRLKPDSTAKDKELEKLYGSFASSVHCVSLYESDGKVYFCTKPSGGENGDLMYYDIATGKTAKVANTSALYFTADGTALYYYNAKEGSICSYTFATGSVKTLATGVKVQSLSVSGGVVYYSDTTTGAAGLWSVRTDGTGKTRLVSGTFAGVSATSLGVVYYEMSYTLTADYPVTSGTGHLYLLKTGATTPTKIV